MNKVSVFDVVLDCVFCLVSLLRICTGRGEVYDYIVVFVTSVILVCYIYRFIKAHKKHQNTDDNNA